MIANTYKLKDGRTINVLSDDDSESPRKWDNNGTMVCLHKRYDLGDKHDYKEGDFSGWSDLKTQIEKDHDVVVILPLFLMDHSGLSISTSDSTFRMCDGAGWDWGMVGWIFASRESLKKGGHPDDVDPEQVKTWLRGEVETFDQFLRGDVYGFQLHAKPCSECGGEGKIEESCWGFYGSNPLENGMSDSFSEEIREELKSLV